MEQALKPGPCVGQGGVSALAARVLGVLLIVPFVGMVGLMTWIGWNVEPRLATWLLLLLFMSGLGLMSLFGIYLLRMQVTSICRAGPDRVLFVSRSLVSTQRRVIDATGLRRVEIKTCRFGKHPSGGVSLALTCADGQVLSAVAHRSKRKSVDGLAADIRRASGAPMVQV